MNCIALVHENNPDTKLWLSELAENSQPIFQYFQVTENSGQSIRTLMVIV